MDLPGVLVFDEGYFEKIWGGRRLADRFGKPIPDGSPIGEAWLIADHANHVSTVAEGPLQGTTLRALLEADAAAVLGTHAALTVHGRFPLLLKILDAQDVLSVQVHPDDETATALGEPDVGKTEMWHVLEAGAESELICGLEPGVGADAFTAAVKQGTVEQHMVRFTVEPGTAVFVPAGTVHAIGSGIVLAEIQQNSDITYRIYDWGRVQADGTPRALHLEQAAKAIHFDAPHAGANTPMRYTRDGAEVEVLAACRYFAAEAVRAPDGVERPTHGTSFHILLARDAPCRVTAKRGVVQLKPGQAALVPASAGTYRVESTGTWLAYYVPDLARDVAEPLRGAGHGTEAIVRLGGAPSRSDLRGVLGGGC